MSGEGKVVCVSGGSGYIASWLIKLLLQRGYTVKATVRNPNDINKNSHLLALDGAQQRLTLFKADLLEDGSFDAAVHGCHAVFHAASPLSFCVSHPQIDIIDPAVKGTLNVLKSCAKVVSIKRVVITSSFATLPFNGKHLTPDVVVDETWFSDPDVCKQKGLFHIFLLWYHMGKTLAEQAAWKFAKDNSIDLITLHPVFVIGPLLQPILNMSAEVILNLVNGCKEYPNSYYSSVDVRDVAYAHIKALEMSSANGRYCLVERYAHFSEILNILHQHYPTTLHLPEKKCESGINYMSNAGKYKISTEKAKGLGISFIPLEVTLKDTIESFKDKGFLSI
ncbi:phenylacetaldehyde reductase-like [Euphorbia lathyris]|uniref:phenylacetaldehyde reductase-like n=1 Tax=Euphorbia lathyris TaxID=212925 RepID=UPI003313E172